MLIFQVNNKIDGESLKPNTWLFWNNYLASRVKENDYVLLPDFIDYIQDTEQPIDASGQFFVELEDEDT